jgi:hypothetical protein
VRSTFTGTPAMRLLAKTGSPTKLINFTPNPGLNIPAATFNAPRTRHQGVEAAVTLDLATDLTGVGDPVERHIPGEAVDPAARARLVGPGALGFERHEGGAEQVRLYEVGPTRRARAAGSTASPGM